MGAKAQRYRTTIQTQVLALNAQSFYNHTHFCRIMLECVQKAKCVVRTCRLSKARCSHTLDFTWQKLSALVLGEPNFHCFFVFWVRQSKAAYIAKPLNQNKPSLVSQSIRVGYINFTFHWVLSRATCSLGLGFLCLLGEKWKRKETNKMVNRK